LLGSCWRGDQKRRGKEGEKDQVRRNANVFHGVLGSVVQTNRQYRLRRADGVPIHGAAGF
jgi:hypothetical protein